ncbi:MAG: DNA-3-methyladenine glycosylase [Planctomycetes bacterium]|nr:DNA-3-methyladenine glycosylase [Planctomycetota bacterium]
MSGARLERSFFARPAAELAPALIGQRLARRLPGGLILSGIIVETEAYIGASDRASHAFGGRRTPRNEAMYAGPGTAYVYFTYGMHFCMNVVCAQADDPQAVLIRALEPDEASQEEFRRRRGVEKPTLLCSGPARLCQALAIDLGLNSLDLCVSNVLWLEKGPGRARRLRRTPRIGVAYAGSWARRLLRWLDADSPHVSKSADGKRSVRSKRGGSKNRKPT